MNTSSDADPLALGEVLDAAPCGFVAFTDNGAIRGVNATLAEMLGYTPAELHGVSVEKILTLAARIFFQTHLLPMVLLHGDAREIFLSLRPRAGDDIPVMANALRRLHGTQGLIHCVLMPVKQRQRYEDELRAAKKEAEAALENNAALRCAQDALEAQTRELDRQVSRLQQRNEDVTRLSSILAHDLREPARKISLFSDMLAQEDTRGMGSNAAWAIQTLAAESGRLTRLLSALQQYLSVATDDGTLVSVDLNATVERALAKHPSNTADGALDITLGPLPSVVGRPRELEVLFWHLLDNAIKFRQPGTPPRVRIEAEIVQRNSFRATHGRYRYVDFAQIVVADHGIGLEGPYKTKIFSPLEKLDPTSDGLGMGLAICKKIVDNHEGTIEVDSRAESGTRFTILLPLEP